MIFRNRSEAGRMLAAALTKYIDRKPVVLALPRGGVPVAAEVAAALNAPLDLVLVRKIGVPFQSELAMGAVVDGGDPITVRNEDVIRLAHIGEAEFEATRDAELAEIERRRAQYLGNRERVNVAGRTAIVVDDGVATGATTRAALRAVRARNPRTLVLAVPVAPSESLEILRREVDDLLCLEDHTPFGAIGFYYHAFGRFPTKRSSNCFSDFPSQPREMSKLQRLEEFIVDPSAIDAKRDFGPVAAAENYGSLRGH